MTRPVYLKSRKEFDRLTKNRRLKMLDNRRLTSRLIKLEERVDQLERMILRQYKRIKEKIGL